VIAAIFFFSICTCYTLYIMDEPVRIRLIRKESAADHTTRFVFTKPEGFTFLPGQSVDLRLIDPTDTDDEGSKRAFSIASAPHEPELHFVMRMRDTAFKRSMSRLEPGDEVLLEGPFGSFMLHEKATRPGVFLAGGMGSTPFRSMMLDAKERALPHRLTLLYSNRRPEDAAFLDELGELSDAEERFVFVPTFSGADIADSAPGARGRIDAPMIQGHVVLSDEPIFYIAGPARFVVSMREMLNSLGVSNDDIRTEEFDGY
jgi:ferredoxin-NADP reductase